jgi:hypothetical protein
VYLIPLFDPPVVNLGNNIVMAMPNKIPKTGLPMIGNIFPRSHAGIAIDRHNRIPEIFL